MAKPSLSGGDNETAIAVGKLRGFVERIERLEEEKATLSEDIKSVKAEAKMEGFDGKALSFLLSMRKKEEAERQVLKTYADALGIFG